MARIRDYAFTEGTVASGTWNADMPQHQTNDLLIAFCQQDGTTGNITNNSSWAEAAGGQISGSGHRMNIFYKLASNGNETFQAATTTSDTFTVTVVAVQNVDTSDPINGYARRTSDDATTPFSGATGLTTDEDNCLLFAYLSTDGGLAPTADPGWINLITGDAAANSGGLSYNYLRTQGSVTPPNYWGQINDNTTATTIAVNDDGSETTVPPYIQPNDSPGQMLELGYWITGGGTNAWGNSYPTSLSLSTIGSKTTVFDSAALTADTGINPYHPSLNCTPPVDTTGANVGGPQLNFGSQVDMTNKILLSSFLFTTPRDYVDLSTATDTGGAGWLLVARDGDAYKAWSVATKNSLTTKPDGRNIIAIQIDQTDATTYANSGTVTNTEIDGLLLLANCRYGAVASLWSCFFLADEFTVVGGSNNTPLNFIDLEFVLSNSLGNFPIMIRDGSAATFLAPIKIGGSDPVHIQVNLRTLQFRTQSDGVDYFDWHVDDNRCGFEFDGQSGDIIHFTNCVFASGSSSYWRFSSDFSSDCDHDFNGTIVISSVVTLRSTVSLTNTTFIDCPLFLQNNSSITNCKFQNTHVTADNPQDISGATFTSGGSGHAIEITTPGTYTFSGNNFSGYGADETTDAAIYNNSNGSVTLNITNGGDTPTVRNGTNASTTIQNAVTLQVTVKDNSGNTIEGAQVWIQKEADDTDTGHPGNPFTLTLGNNQGNGDISVNETAPDDVPSSGWIRIKTGRDEQMYRYQSRTDNTFTLNSEVTGTDNGTGTSTVINETNIGTKDIVEGDTIRNTTSDPDEWATVLSVSTNSITTTALTGGATWTAASYSVHRLAVKYKSGDTATIPLTNRKTDALGLVTESYNYISDKDILVRIRLASGSPDYLPYSTAGTITSSGYTLVATLQNDTIKS